MKNYYIMYMLYISFDRVALIEGGGGGGVLIAVGGGGCLIAQVSS